MKMSSRILSRSPFTKTVRCTPTARSLSFAKPGYQLPVIMPPYFKDQNNWKTDTAETYAMFRKTFGNSPLVCVGTGIISQGLHEFCRVNNHGFRAGGVDNGLDITSKRSIRGFIKHALNTYDVKEGEKVAVFNGAAFLSAHPNIAGSIDVNVGGAINLIIVAQEIKKDRNIDLVLITPSSIARDQLSSPYGTGKRLVENLTSFQNLSTPTDFRSVILPGLISGLNPFGGSTDTYDGLARHVAHLMVINKADPKDKAMVRKALRMHPDSDDFVSWVKTDRKVSMAGVKDVVKSLVKCFALEKLPKAIPICGGESMSYSVNDGEAALKKYLGSSYPTFEIVEELGVQQKNLEEWGPIGQCLPNVDAEYKINTAEESLDVSMVHAFEHYEKLAMELITPPSVVANY